MTSASGEPVDYAKLTPEAPLAAVPDMGATPSEDAWLVAKDMGAFGISGSVSCVTRTIGKWLRVTCGGEVPTVGASPIRGAHKDQTKVEVRDGALLFTTPFVEGTDVVARVDFANVRKFLVVAWPKGGKAEPVRFADNR